MARYTICVDTRPQPLCRGCQYRWHINNDETGKQTQLTGWESSIEKSAMAAVKCFHDFIIEPYKACLLEELEKLGATENDCALVSDELVNNAVQNGREARDIAWAIVQ